jgi:hypothetical protein
MFVSVYVTFRQQRFGRIFCIRLQGTDRNFIVFCIVEFGK